MAAIEEQNHSLAPKKYKDAEKALNVAQAQLDRDISYWLSRIADFKINTTHGN